MGAWSYSSTKLIGDLFLTSAAIIVGIVLAVIDQTYQTNASQYALFVTWALLIIPWVMISKFSPLWLLWVILTNCALILYLSEMVDYPILHMHLFTYLAWF